MDYDQVLSQLAVQIEANQIDKNDTNKFVSYGTAGFRGLAEDIKHIFFNVGLIAGLKSLVANGNIGIMITASHNPIHDNGVKLIDSNGEMLDVKWEQIVEKFCNTHDKDQIIDQLKNLLKNEKSSSGYLNNNSKVLIGMDTRPSSEALVSLVKSGLDVWKCVQFIDYGLVTTPALHYLVAESNKRNQILNIETYYHQLIQGSLDIFGISEKTDLYSAKQLVVDCSNGVGTKTMQYIRNNADFASIFPLKLINTFDGTLNESCGADYVKTTKKIPTKALEISETLVGPGPVRFASLDGDADRVVYFYLSYEKQLILLDGDKIMALYVLYLKELLVQYNLEDQLTLGCVQTAYANGSSTDYLEKILQVPVDCVDTGVKNLHRQALNYDFGVYFEANGHGTIWISPKAKSLIEQADMERYFEFRKLFKIINNYTGDAISDILVVETILKHFNWDVKKWDKLYKDRPNSLLKVSIRDRDSIKTTNAGRTCLEPSGLQERIDREVNKYNVGARCFIRPSGTENVVRVYAEADRQDLADELGKAVCEIVKQYCNDNNSN